MFPSIFKRTTINLLFTTGMAVLTSYANAAETHFPSVSIPVTELKYGATGVSDKFDYVLVPDHK